MKYINEFLKELFHPDYLWTLATLLFTVPFTHYLHLGLVGEMVVACPLVIAVYFFRKIFCVKGFGNSLKWKWLCNKDLLTSMDHWIRALSLAAMIAGALIIEHCYKW